MVSVCWSWKARGDDMTVQNSNVKNIYIGNGSTTSFPFTFPCPKAEYIKVFVRKNNLIAQTDDFTVDLDNATVTYPKSGTPLAAGENLVILRELPLKQPLNLVNQGPFFAEDIETTLDEEVMMIQQLREELSRSLTVPVDIDAENAFETSVPIKPGMSFRVKDDGSGFEVTTDPGKVIDEANALHAQINKDVGALLEQTKAEANKAVDAKDGAEQALKNATDKATEAAESLKLIQKHKALWYDNIAAMKADVSIKDGSYACTAGYYKANDGGGGSYIIRAKTVEDVEDGGSIHFLQKDLVAELIVENGTVNVKQFGAKGDGESDDTDYLRKVLKYSSDNKIMLILPPNKIYYVTDTLNKIDGTYVDLTFNIIGHNYSDNYTAKYGGIKVANNVDLFANCTFTGRIANISIKGNRSGGSNVFRKCALTGLKFEKNHIANFENFGLGASLSALTKISKNIFLSVFNFLNIDDVNKTVSDITDSTINDNYINGGKEPTDNVCFGILGGNGSVITHNFVDYYNTIFCYKGAPSIPFKPPISVCNQYQVFRYFYRRNGATSIFFQSDNDIFNWTDVAAPTTADVLPKYKKYTYEGRDGQTYELPEYIAMPDTYGAISITNTKIERNVGNILVLNSGMYDIEYSKFIFTIASCEKMNVNKTSIAVKKGDPEAPIISGNKYAYMNKYNCNLYREVDALPYLNHVWTNAVIGERVIYQKCIYEAKCRWDSDSSAYVTSWEKV